MSTDFLNRRMDLKHTSSFENHLTMDTSYPVKLAGKVMKLFTASSDFNANKWILENSDKEVILTIESDNVYDFAGRVIKNSVGIGRAYTTNKDVFKQDDYIMVIIDFDNKKMLLCSETNFKKFITGEDISSITSNIRMYTIDGTTKINGFEYPIDTEKFDTAAEYESGPDTYALVRSDVDKVVYETPTTKNNGDNDEERNMIPVANVNTIDINSLNVSVQNFVFPFIDLYFSNSGFENVYRLHTYTSINGAVNDKFIKEFCFTHEELINLPLFKKNLGYIQQEYNNISGDKTKYYYVLTSINGGDKTETYIRDMSFTFTPISINNNKFSIFNTIDVDITVGNKGSVQLSTKGLQSLLIGNRYTHDNFNGFYVFEAALNNGNGQYIRKSILIDGFLENSNNQFPYDLFIKNERNENNMGESCIKSIRDSVDTVKRIFNNNEMKYVKRFVEFFSSDDWYSNYIKNKILKLGNDIGNIWNFPKFCKENNTNEYDTIPKNIVVMYPEVFENILFDKNTDGSFKYSLENIRNFEDFHNDKIKDIVESVGFDRKRYDASQYLLNDGNGNDYLIYLLLNHNVNSGYITNIANNSLYEQYIYGLGDATTIYNHVKFNSNNSLIDNDGSHQYIVKDKFNNNILASIITRVNLTNLSDPDDSRYVDNKVKKDYNVAQIGVQDLLVTRKIYFADEYISYENNEYKLYPNGKNNGEGYVLYIAVNTGNNNIQMKKLTPPGPNGGYFKNPTNIGTDVRGIMYLYYKEGYNIKRIKYYYNSNDNNNAINKYDYFTYSMTVLGYDAGFESVLFYSNPTTRPDYADKKYRFGNESDFIKAFINNYIVENGLDDSIDESYNTAFAYINNLINTDNDNLDESNNSLSTLITTVIKAYNLYPVKIENGEYNKVISTKKYGGYNTLSLIKDFNKYVGASINDKNRINKDNTHGFRLKNIIDDYYTMGENPLVPYVSNTQRDGVYIYNIKTYNDYIKSTKVNQVFRTEEFPYLNGIGIREEYYKDKSLYEFYLYALTRNLAVPMSDDKSWLNNNYYGFGTNKLFFTRTEVEKIKDIVVKTDPVSKEDYEALVDENNKNVTVTSSLSLHNNINLKSIFGLNKSELIDSNTGVNVMENYSSEDSIFINKEQTGEKAVYSVSMNDGDANIPVLLSINGVMDNIEVDKLTWETLLLALHNNKTIDILSKSLIQIKTELNDYFFLTGQNINDTISIEDNDNMDMIANDHDTIYDPDSSDSEDTKKFKEQHYRDVNAEYDEKHNIYNFNFGYGFTNNKRELNNRGVIVFVSDGASTKCNTKGQINPAGFEYEFTEGNVYPKRMFISKDGIICTKDYYDAENNDDPSGGGSGSDIITFNKIINIINEMQNQHEEDMSEISQYIFNNVKKQINFNTVVLDQIESSTGKRREVFMYMLSDTNDDNLTYTNTCKYKVSKSGNKLVVDNTSGEEHEFIAGEALINGIPYIFAPNGVLECGFQTVGNDSGRLKVGNILISDKRYFYDYNTGNIKLGWVEKNGCKYYCTLLDGKLTTQYRTFGNGTSKHTYWFDEYGIATEVEGIPADIQYQINSLQEQIDNLKIATSDVYTHLTSTIYEYNEMILAVLSIKLSDEASISALSKGNLDFKRKKFSTANEIASDIFTYNNYVYNTMTFTAGVDEGYHNRLDAKNDSIYDSTTNDELVSNIKSYNTEFINYLHSVGWINDKSSAESVNAKISMT